MNDLYSFFAVQLNQILGFQNILTFIDQCIQIYPKQLHDKLAFAGYPFFIIFHFLKTTSVIA